MQFCGNFFLACGIAVKTERFSVFINLVNFDELLTYSSVFPCDFPVFRAPLTTPSSSRNTYATRHLFHQNISVLRILPPL